MKSNEIVVETIKAVAAYGAGAATAAVMAAQGLPGAAVSAGAIAAGAGGAMAGFVGTILQDRIDREFKLLIERLASAEITVLDAAAQNNFVSMLVRFQRAICEGAAEQNLQLMAQVMKHQLEGGRLHVDEFKHHADVLASLKRDEIIILATVLRVERTLRAANVPLWEGEVPAHKIWEQVDAALIAPHLFQSKSELRGIAWGLFRTGMFKIGNTIDEDLEPKPAPLLMEIAKLCDLEAEGTNLSMHGRV
jgi:hypothetical protein